MNNKSSGKTKAKSGFSVIVIDLRRKTRIVGFVCFSILVCAAVFGFMQTRRAIYEMGNPAAELTDKGSVEEIAIGNSDVSFANAFGGEEEDDSLSFTTETMLPSESAESFFPETTVSAAALGKYTFTAKKTTSGVTQKPNSVRISATPVNIRSGAGKKYSIVARTKKGAVYQLLATKKGADNKDWCQIALKNGKTGWVMKSCCTLGYLSSFDDQKTTASAKKTTAAKSKSRSVEVTVTPVNIRSGAGRENAVISRSAKGRVYKLLSIDKDKLKNEWYKVELDGGESGWILKSCCRIIEETDTKTAATTKKTAAAVTKTTTAKSKSRSVEVTVTPVNIRSGAGKGNAVISRASKGSVYKLLSIDKDKLKNEWYKVELDGDKVGWILKSCCRIIEESAADKKTEPTARKTTAATKKTTSTATSDEKLLKKLQPKNHDAKYFIVVYKGSQSVVVYGKDKKGDYTKEVKIFTCSTGKKTSPTRTGTYHIRAKYRWRSLVGGVYGQYSSSISKSYLFHSVPYEKQSASSLEDEEYDKLGKPASKGCVRLCVRDSKWIYDKCEIGTQVRIVDDSGPEGPGVPSRKKTSKFSGWDPSDKWAKDNPYFD